VYGVVSRDAICGGQGRAVAPPLGFKAKKIFLYILLKLGVQIVHTHSFSLI
jgi:hypothetical protein